MELCYKLQPLLFFLNVKLNSNSMYSVAELRTKIYVHLIRTIYRGFISKLELQAVCLFDMHYISL